MAEKISLKKEVEAVCLRDCVFGTAGDVVTLSLADAETGKAQGMLDMHPDAIKFAKQKGN